VLKSNRPLERSYRVLCAQNGLPCAVILVGFLAVKFAMMINPKIVSTVLIITRASASGSSDLTITPLRIDTDTTNNPK
jgi:hypothetical protein